MSDEVDEIAPAFNASRLGRLLRIGYVREVELRQQHGAKIQSFSAYRKAVLQPTRVQLLPRKSRKKKRAKPVCAAKGVAVCSLVPHGAPTVDEGAIDILARTVFSRPRSREGIA